MYDSHQYVISWILSAVDETNNHHARQLPFCIYYRRHIYSWLIWPSCEVCTWPASACATAGAKMARMGSAKYPSADTLQVNASARVEWNCAWKYKLCTVSGWLCLENQVLESFELGKRMHLAQQQKKNSNGKWEIFVGRMLVMELISACGMKLCIKMQFVWSVRYGIFGNSVVYGVCVRKVSEFVAAGNSPNRNCESCLVGKRAKCWGFCNMRIWIKWHDLHMVSELVLGCHCLGAEVMHDKWAYLFKKWLNWKLQIIPWRDEFGQIRETWWYEKKNL